MVEQIGIAKLDRDPAFQRQAAALRGARAALENSRYAASRSRVGELHRDEAEYYRSAGFTHDDMVELARLSADERAQLLPTIDDLAAVRLVAAGRRDADGRPMEAGYVRGLLQDKAAELGIALPDALRA